MVVEYDTASPAELRDLAEVIAWEEPDIAEDLMDLADIRDREPLAMDVTGEEQDDGEGTWEAAGFGVYHVTEFGDLAEEVESK